MSREIDALPDTASKFGIQYRKRETQQATSDERFLLAVTDPN